MAAHYVILIMACRRTRPARTRVKANSRIHALPSPAMSTPPGWEPRPGPTRGDPARRAPRGSGGWARDDGDPRRQGERGGASAAGRGWDSGPSFTPGRPPVQRDSGPGSGPGPRAPRGGQGHPSANPGGYDRRGPLADDFTGRPRSSGEGRAVSQDRPLGGSANGLDGLRSGGLTRWLGRMSTRTALLVLVAAALLGVIVTFVARPGARGPARVLHHHGRDRRRAWHPARQGLPALPGTCPGVLHGGRRNRQGPRRQARIVHGRARLWLHAVGRGHLLPRGGGDHRRRADRRQPLAARPPAHHRPVPAVRGQASPGQRAPCRRIPPPRCR